MIAVFYVVYIRYATKSSSNFALPAKRRGWQVNPSSPFLFRGNAHDRVSCLRTCILIYTAYIRCATNRNGEFRTMNGSWSLRVEKLGEQFVGGDSQGEASK